MGIVKDFLDIAKDIATGSEDASKKLMEKKYSSISRRSLEGTLQFPVLVSTSLDMDTIQMIAKALEKNYASFAQISMTMNPFMKLNTEKDVSDYIRNFHQNSDTKSSLSDLGNAMSTMIASRENFQILSNETDDIYMFSLIHEGVSNKLYEANIEFLKCLNSELNLDVANNKFNPGFNYKLTGVSEGLNQKYNILKEDMSPLATYAPSGKEGKISELPKEVLKWAQTQKLNELMPTQLTLKIKVLDKDQKIAIGDLEVVVGIKATIHPIKTDDMIINTVNACKNNDKIFNFIRWTTGEISFLKDFIFNINEIRNDVASTSSGASGWWSALKRRRALASMKNALPTMLSKSILPNTTLVLSMEEVNYIKNEYGYDLMSTYFLTRIMQTYFLLGFVVIDNSTQVAHFMFDGQTSFQTHVISSLKKESNEDQNFKQMLNIIRRV